MTWKQSWKQVKSLTPRLVISFFKQCWHRTFLKCTQRGEEFWRRRDIFLKSSMLKHINYFYIFEIDVLFRNTNFAEEDYWKRVTFFSKWKNIVRLQILTSQRYIPFLFLLYKPFQIRSAFSKCTFRTGGFEEHNGISYYKPMYRFTFSSLGDRYYVR